MKHPAAAVLVVTTVAITVLVVMMRFSGVEAFLVLVLLVAPAIVGAAESRQEQAERGQP